MWAILQKGGTRLYHSLERCNQIVSFFRWEGTRLYHSLERCNKIVSFFRWEGNKLCFSLEGCNQIVQFFRGGNPILSFFRGGYPILSTSWGGLIFHLMPIIQLRGFNSNLHRTHIEVFLKRMQMRQGVASTFCQNLGDDRFCQRK